MTAVLEVDRLSTRFATPDGEVLAADEVGFTIGAGESLGVVGESGSGKTQIFLSIMGLLAKNGRSTGSVRYRGKEILNLPARDLNKIRGDDLAMIFQDPMTSLNPYLKISRQLTEVMREHKGMDEAEARRRGIAMLELVGIPEAARRFDMYPHEFSGGMRQRVMIAMALLCEPDLLIADEPTTALDVTVQAQILELLGRLKRELGMAIALITHDLGVVAGLCERVMVMYAGRAVEVAPAADLFRRPAAPLHQGPAALDAAARRGGHDRADHHPRPAAEPAGPAARLRVRRPLPLRVRPLPDGAAAARGLRPRPCQGLPPGAAAMTAPILSVRDLKVHFPIPAGGFLRRRYVPLKAVDGVSFELRPGETLGIVGELGCGKSTLGRALLQLIPSTDGQVIWLGENLAGRDSQAMRRYRRDLQIIFQDPLASLDPRMPVGEIIAEPLITHEPGLARAQVRARVQEMMRAVGLLPQMINRYPHEFSGGQCQRIGIARAMILKPKLIVCDEPVSALDVSIQAQIVNLLMALQREFGLSLIFISHNLAVVRHICHRIMVLYLGRMAEIASRDDLYARPRHPYTQALISAVPIPDPELERSRHRIVLTGDLPSPLRPPSGCVFRTRCPRASEVCAERLPAVEVVAGDHEVACHHWRET